MGKRGLWLLLALVLLAGPVWAADLDVAAESAILMEKSTGQVLYEQNGDEQLAPASVTKVMTLLLVMEALEEGRISWSDTVTASAAAAEKGGSQVYLEEHEQMSMEDMVKSVVIASANDCACALAEHIYGSESAFVEKMNQRAAELGMTNTHFVNCTGLDDDPEAATHLTTARDIAIMSRELLKHEKIKEYSTIWMDTIRDGQFGLSNTNKLVRFYDGTTGLKTGYTSGAGFCLAASAQRGGMELVAVVMKSPSSQDRFESAKALLNYGFSNYALVQPAPGEEIPAVPVTLGHAEFVTPVLQSSDPMLLDKAQAANVKTTLEVAEGVTAPVEQGQQLGLLTVTAGGETVAQIPLVAPEPVERLTFLDIWGMVLHKLCMG